MSPLTAQMLLPKVEEMNLSGITLTGKIIGHSIVATMDVPVELRGRYFAPFVDGIYRGPNVWVSSKKYFCPLTFSRCCHHTLKPNGTSKLVIYDADKLPCGIPTELIDTDSINLQLTKIVNPPKRRKILSKEQTYKGLGLTTPDLSAFQLIAAYCDDSGNPISPLNSTTPPGVSFVASTRLCSGEQPSSAFAPFPTRGLLTDEIAPNVAMQTDGPAGILKPRYRAKVSYIDPNNSNNTLDLFTGIVAQITHDIGDDSATAEIFGDALLFAKTAVFGRCCFEPLSSTYYFDSTTPTVFNQFGWADCLDTANGPMFAPSPRFGWPSDLGTENFVEPLPGLAYTQARSWTVGDGIQYLKNWCNPAATVPAISFPGNFLLNSWIEWPDTATNIFGNNTYRLLRDVDINGLSLDRALTILCRKAGAWNWYLTPGTGINNFGSILSFINMAPLPASQSPIAISLPGFSQDMSDYNDYGLMIQRGYLKESCVNYFDDTSILAPGICGEKTCANTPAGFTSGDPNWLIGQGMLKNGWSAADETAFQAFVTANGNIEPAFRAACWKWPYVYCAYCTTGDFFKNTKWSQTSGDGGTGISGQTGPYARIRPFILSSTSLDASGNLADYAPRDIVIEIANSAFGTVGVQGGPIEDFLVQQRTESIEISPNGQYIMLPSLRDSGRTWGSSPGQAPFNGATLYPKCIRLSLACYGQTPIVGRNTTDPNNVGTRIATAAAGNTWTYWAVSLIEEERYVDWVRGVSPSSASQGSWPQGTLLQTQAVNRAGIPPSAGLEFFSDLGDPANPDPVNYRLPSHALKRQTDVKRLNQGGELIAQWYNPAMVPGVPVSVGQPSTYTGANNIIPNYSVLQSVDINMMTNEVIYELAGPELQQIYDLPAIGGAQSIGGETGSHFIPFTISAAHAGEAGNMSVQKANENFAAQWTPNPGDHALMLNPFPAPYSPGGFRTD